MITSCTIKKIQETAVTVTSAIVTYRDLGRVRLRSTWLCRHHEKYIEIIIIMINGSKISVHRFIATTLFRIVEERPHSSGNNE